MQQADPMPASPQRSLRNRLQHGETLVAPGVFDACSARIIEELGYAAIYLGGNGLGISLALGQPFVTLADTVEAIFRICGAVSLPLIADAGAGFGEPAHIYRTVSDCEHAGAAAIHIDDQPYPKRAHYHRGHGHVVDIATVTDKLKAALDARRDADFSIYARTDILRTTGSIEQALERAGALCATGIDALIVLDLDPARIGPFKKIAGKTPLIWIGGIIEPVPSVDELTACNFAAALFPFNTSAAAIQAIHSMWLDFRRTGRPVAREPSTKETLALAMQFLHMVKYWKIEEATTEKPAQKNAADDKF
jgi:2-methylisocitrate lyase-like PEP mutase family enzyme